MNQLPQTEEKYNTKINTKNTKSILKEPIGCKLEFKGRIIEQVKNFSHLRELIISYGNIIEEVKIQNQQGWNSIGDIKGFGVI